VGGCFFFFFLVVFFFFFFLLLGLFLVFFVCVFFFFFFFFFFWVGFFFFFGFLGFLRGFFFLGFFFFFFFGVFWGLFGGSFPTPPPFLSIFFFFLAILHKWCTSWSQPPFFLNLFTQEVNSFFFNYGARFPPPPGEFPPSLLSFLPEYLLDDPIRSSSFSFPSQRSSRSSIQKIFKHGPLRVSDLSVLGRRISSAFPVKLLTRCSPFRFCGYLMPPASLLHSPPLFLFLPIISKDEKSGL